MLLLGSFGCKLSDGKCNTLVVIYSGYVGIDKMKGVWEGTLSDGKMNFSRVRSVLKGYVSTK